MLPNAACPDLMNWAIVEWLGMLSSLCGISRCKYRREHYPRSLLIFNFHFGLDLLHPPFFVDSGCHCAIGSVALTASIGSLAEYGYLLKIAFMSFDHIQAVPHQSFYVGNALENRKVGSDVLSRERDVNNDSGRKQDAVPDLALKPKSFRKGTGVTTRCRSAGALTEHRAASPRILCTRPDESCHIFPACQCALWDTHVCIHPV